MAQAGSGLAGAAALVVGFDPFSNRWVSAADAPESSFSAVPPLDGRIVYDDTRNIGSTDQGNIVHHRPQAVLQPGSVNDWRARYGESSSRFSALKKRFDPDKILTPGPGIF
jgi:hypothetical protein